MNIREIPEHVGLCFTCSPRGLWVRQPLHTHWHLDQAAMAGEINLESALRR
jgi:hypothetical protein